MLNEVSNGAGSSFDYYIVNGKAYRLAFPVKLDRHRKVKKVSEQKFRRHIERRSME